MTRQARAIATREAIVQGAGIVFGEVSYATATLQDVIAHAGVTQGALYFHFDSKLDLAGEVIRQQHELSMRAAGRFADEDLPRLDALILLSGELARQIRREPIVQGGLRLTTESGQLFPDHSRGPYLDWIESTEHFLRGAAVEGRLRADLDIRAMARYVISAFTGVQVVSRSLTGWADFVDRLEEMWQLQLPLILDDPLQGEVARLAKLVRSADA